MERPVFILCPRESFTPTQSGAIATATWEMCRAAQAQGVKPVVIGARADVPSYEGVEFLAVDYPPEARGWRKALARAERKLCGWTLTGHRSHARQVRRHLEKAGLTGSPLIVANDPELAVWLRRCFPRASITHVFHNQLGCKPRARAAYAAAVNATFAVSEFTARWVADCYGLPGLAVRILPNGVDGTHFRPAAVEPAGKTVIGFVGRTGREKAPDLLLRAALRLAERTTDFALQMVGSNHWDRFEQDAYQAELQTLSRELAVRGVEVRWLGHVSRAELPGVLRAAHVQVVPSRWDEPFGLVTLEGMASGLAVVASRTGGTPEVVGAGGLLFERDSAEELAAHLETLVRDSERRRELARAGRRRAETYTWQNTWEILRGASQPVDPALVSVIIPAYNAEEYLAEAIESALAQTYRPVEVIVVDDGSTDKTPAVAAAFAGRIVYVRQPNGGTASARNTAVRRASGAYLAMLDADDRWLPEKLERQMPVFAESPRVGIVCGGVRFFSTYPGQPGWEEFPPERLTLPDILAQRMPPSQTTVYRREALESVGGFDQTLRGGEDWDAALRVVVKWEARGLREVLAEARVHPANKGADKSRSFQRGMRVLERHARLHRASAACRVAAASTRRKLRDFCSSSLREAAASDWRSGGRGAALRKMARALWMDPWAVRKVLRRFSGAGANGPRAEVAS